jgi:hypothetical protein
MAKFGIVNLSLAIVAAGCLITATAALVHNGPGIDDLPAVKEGAEALFALRDFKAAELMSEISDVDSAEAKALAELFKTHFDIQADTVEETIEKGVTILLQVLPFILEVFARTKKLAA